MSRTVAVLLALFALTGAACVTGHRGGPTDSGTDSGPAVDAGTHDSGVIVLPDLGPRDSGSTGGDAGACGAMVPYLDMVLCDMATQACIGACAPTDTTCPDTCLASDSHGTDCTACLNQNEFACANSLTPGCMAQWHTYDCCVSANCPMGSATDCAMTSCGTEQTAYGNCLNMVLTASTPCLSHARGCFSTTPP